MFGPLFILMLWQSNMKTNNRIYIVYYIFGKHLFRLEIMQHWLLVLIINHILSSETRPCNYTA